MFERATLDWLKADKVTPRHHLPVIPLTARVLPLVSATAKVAYQAKKVLMCSDSITPWGMQYVWSIDAIVFILC